MSARRISFPILYVLSSRHSPHSSWLMLPRQKELAHPFSQENAQCFSHDAESKGATRAESWIVSDPP
jgi:hypothetical protein